METKIIHKGKYTFKITDNTLFIRDQIYCRNFKIGSETADCVNISISYKDNQPVSASMPYVVYLPECSIDVPLDKGNGSIIMIRTLLDYVHKQIPSITEIMFEDKSNIECATEDEIKTKSSRFRKSGTNVYPIPLYYFSIAFNGQTWYEKHFSAKQKVAHEEYRERINYLLTHPKTEPFLTFVQIAKPPIDIIHELEEYYEKSRTLEEFFQSMPKEDRCRLVREWIEPFMKYHLRDVFANDGWVIELPITVIGGGKKSRRRYYLPKGIIRYNTTMKDFGINVKNI